MGRGHFRNLSEHDFGQIIKNQNIYNLRGGALTDINVFRTKKRYLQGSGFLSSIASLGKLLMPAVKRYLLPSAVSFTSGLIKDIGAGKNIRESAKRRGKKSLKKMGSRILSGKGIESKKVRISQKGGKGRNVRKNLKTVKKKKKKRAGSGLRNNKLNIKSKNKKKQKSKSVKQRYSDIFS